MSHVDEGTVHAWIDGALSPEETARVETHVAVCPECSARVAEARGLAAAASRILTALDTVPGGVVPPVPAVRASRVRGMRGMRAQGMRTWASPAVRAAAAVLVVAGGALLVTRGGAGHSETGARGPTQPAALATGPATMADAESGAASPAAATAPLPGGPPQGASLPAQRVTVSGRAARMSVSPLVPVPAPGSGTRVTEPARTPAGAGEAWSRTAKALRVKAAAEQASTAVPHQRLAGALIDATSGAPLAGAAGSVSGTMVGAETSAEARSSRGLPASDRAGTPSVQPAGTEPTVPSVRPPDTATALALRPVVTGKITGAASLASPAGRPLRGGILPGCVAIGHDGTPARPGRREEDVGIPDALFPSLVALADAPSPRGAGWRIARVLSAPTRDSVTVGAWHATASGAVAEWGVPSGTRLSARLALVLAGDAGSVTLTRPGQAAATSAAVVRPVSCDVRP